MGNEEGDQCGSLDFAGIVATCTDEIDLQLQITPMRTTLPAKLTFQIINNTASPYRIAPNLDPVVYKKTGDDWTKIPLAGRFPFPEHVTVTDSYSYTKEIPYSNWNPEPGSYLFLVYGKLLSEGEWENVNVVDTVEIQ